MVTVAPPPSGAASFSVTLTNTSSATIAQPAFLMLPVPVTYGSLSAAPPCHVDNPGLAITLIGPPLIGGASVTCELTFSRSFATPFPSFVIRPNPDPSSAAVRISPERWGLGVFADPALTISPVYPLPLLGSTEAIFRLTASNPGTSTMQGLEAGGCAMATATMMTLDLDFPGGCAPATSPVALCLGGYVGFGVKLPDVPPQSQQSCLVRARRTAGLVEASVWPFMLQLPSEAVVEPGYVVGDSNYENNVAWISVGFAEPERPIPAGRTGLYFAFTLALLAIGSIQLQVQRRVTKNGASV